MRERTRGSLEAVQLSSAVAFSAGVPGWAGEGIHGQWVCELSRSTGLQLHRGVECKRIYQ